MCSCNTETCKRAFNEAWSESWTVEKTHFLSFNQDQTSQSHRAVSLSLKKKELKKISIHY